MPADRNTLTLDEIRAAWDRYRSANFTHVGESSDAAGVWFWSAAHAFDFVTAGMHLDGVPAAGVDVGPKTFALKAFGALHLIPLTSIKVGSLATVQPQMTFRVDQQQACNLAEQLDAEQTLRRLVQQRFLFKAAPGGANGTLQ